MIIHVLRKPLTGTVAANVLAHGTGAINVDGCRVGATKRVPGSPKKAAASTHTVSLPGYDGGSGHDPSVGRWPANVLLDEAAAIVLDAQSGNMPPSLRKARTGTAVGEIFRIPNDGQPKGHDDRGGASRFFQKVDLTCLSQTP